MPFPGFFSSEADVFAWLRLSAWSSVSWRHNLMPIALGNDGVIATPLSLVHGDCASDSCALLSSDCFRLPTSGSASSALPSFDGDFDSRVCPPVSGRSRPLRPITLSPRQLRRVMAARETLFKFGTFVPRNDQEASASPEAPRWRAGRDLEWLRLNETGTFESDWTLARMESAFPSYLKRDIGHLFYVYDFKFSGEHRVRLIFDGSRQSPSTYTETYVPTAR
jgi:hypothetical protein